MAVLPTMAVQLAVWEPRSACFITALSMQACTCTCRVDRCGCCEPKHLCVAPHMACNEWGSPVGYCQLRGNELSAFTTVCCAGGGRHVGRWVVGLVGADIPGHVCLFEDVAVHLLQRQSVPDTRC